MRLGNIILLNGTSSSGKTNIVKALQEVMDEPYLDAGIDKFLWMLPSRYLNTALWHEVYEYVWPEDGRHEGLAIKAGPLGHRLMSGMHHAIAALSQAGNNVVADHVLAEPAWVQECAELLAELPALFVGIRCPLAVLEQREKNRRDRTLGQARAQLDLVHAHGIYDFEVDTSRYSALDCALQIKERVETGPPPMAFRRLRDV
ncbi:MAG TPA: chloramphenicol phosphotransferase [Anaerolineae bacterium]